MLDALANRADRELLLQLHASRNLQDLPILAHRIKGGALMVRAASLIQCCEQLEPACGEGCAALIDEAVDQLQQAMTRLDQRLASG